MVQEVLERGARVIATPLHFGCPSCGAVLSVPETMAGVAGPCPMCGGWVVSPSGAEEGIGRGGAGFVSRRPPLVEVRREQLPPLRPEGRVNWRERRARHERLVSWFQRSQARLCVVALCVAALTLVFLHSQGWNLPWNVPEDSALMRFLEEFARPASDGVGELPTGPVRRK